MIDGRHSSAHRGTGTGEPAVDSFRSGDALFLVDRARRILAWNEGAEALTGVPAEEAVGSFCWQVVAGQSPEGETVCHARCSCARLAGEGWPVRSKELSIKSHGGRRLVSVATVGVRDGNEGRVLHLLRPSGEETAKGPGGPSLTVRQLEVLRLLAQGVPPKLIASRLGVTLATVRNHIRAVLLELGAHSQLEAVARARIARLV